MPGSDVPQWLWRAVVGALVGLLVLVGGWWCAQIDAKVDDVRDDVTRIRCALEVQAGGDCWD